MGKSRLASCGDTAPFSWVLVHTGFCLCIQGSVSLVLCKFSWLYGGVNGDHLLEGLCHTSTSSRAPVPEAGDCWPVPLQKMPTQVWLSLCGISDSWCTQSFVWCLRASLAEMGFDSKSGFAPPTILLLLFPCMWGIFFFFFCRIQHSPFNGCSAVSCNFGGLSGEDEHMFSTLLSWSQLNLHSIELAHWRYLKKP